MDKFKVFATIVLAAIMTGCGAVGSVNSAIQQMREYYTRGVHLETAWSAAFAASEKVYSDGMQSILDQTPLANQCFTNTGAIKSALAGVYDQNGQMAPGQFSNAIAINQSYPDVTVCQKALTSLMTQIAAWRQTNTDAAKINLQYQAEFLNFMNDDVMKRFVTDFIQNHQAEFKSAGLPTSFLGFPTDNLHAELRDQEICNYYGSQQLSNPLYMASWNRALGTCQLKRQAAFEFMTRLLVTGQTVNRYNCGLDAGLNDKVSASCTVEAPAATQAPLAPTDPKQVTTKSAMTMTPVLR